jgi:hypothetical protein
MNEALIDSFESLSSPTSEAGTDVFSTIPISRGHQIGKDATGLPVLLVAVKDSGHKTRSLRLLNFRVDHQLRCRITDSEERMSEGVYSVIRCLSDDRETQRFFFRSMKLVLEQLPLTATDTVLAGLVDRLCNLFIAMSRPASRTVQSLWAELFLVRECREPALAINAWRQQDHDAFDFMFDDYRIDVKSSSNKRRSHFFSHAQVHPPGGQQAIIASIFTDRVANGLSLGILWDQVRDAAGTSTELQAKVDDVCVNSLGASWNESRTITFDEALAVESLAFYNVDDIPRIEASLPVGVSEVRFKADLSLSPTVGSVDLFCT